MRFKEYSLVSFFLKETIFFMNSDAHRLDMISEPIHQISKDEFYGLWRKRYG